MRAHEPVNYELAEGKVVKKIIARKFIFFAVVNWIMICGCIFLFTPGKSEGLLDPYLVSMYLLALLAVLIQYPFLQNAGTWKLKLLIFYISMVLFLFTFGVYFTWNESVGSYKAGTWDARYGGGMRFVYFGHIFGGWLFPVVVFANWTLRKRFFNDHPNENLNS